jgi:hypothetical protein
MVEGEISNEQQRSYTSTIAVSASESFSDPASIDTLWPQEVAHNPDFLTQIGDYQKRVEDVNTILNVLPSPDTTLQEALESHIVTARQIETLYSHLSDLLSNSDYERLALYLPFELIPDATWQADDVYLQASIDRLATTYMNAWFSLLGTQDVRANFVDGDVLEEELRDGDLPRVIKATHLIPQLVRKGLLDSASIEQLLTQSNDPLLTRELTAQLVTLQSDTPEYASQVTATLSLDTLHELERLYGGEAIVITEPTTERRTAWLTQKRVDALINTYSQDIAQEIKSGLRERTVSTCLAAVHDHNLADILFIKVVQRAIESTDADTARELYDCFAGDILSLFQTATPALSEHLVTTFRHFYRLGLIDSSVLDSLDIVIPTLSGPLSQNLELMPSEIQKIQAATDIFATHPFLSTHIYPVLSVGGSRLKGYGEQTSDVDVGIFVQPHVSDLDKDTLRRHVMDVFETVGIADEPFEIWLEQSGKDLRVRPLVDPEAVIADHYWTHILFGTAWVGDSESITSIRKSLLPSYFSHSEDRAYYLERLEQDILQYRLMHKGYVRHYPHRQTITTADFTDGDSTFWDPGYRQLATRLYVEKVFLPKI